MAARLPGAEVISIRPGDSEPARGGDQPARTRALPGRVRFPLQTHRGPAPALFLAAFQADNRSRKSSAQH